MKAAVVGGGILGLTLARRLAGLGHQVELFEAEPKVGGLAASQPFADFVWDRFYHCILPQDGELLGLLEELGLGRELRWTRTGTGYYAGGRFYSMSGNADFLRFPLLSFVDKARLGVTLLHATHTARPRDLYHVTAEAWLTRWCGRQCYQTFWQPLLKAKFGPYHSNVAAVFIWATLTRLQGARRGGAAREHLGYVRGGYARILERLRQELDDRGAIVRTAAPVTGIGIIEAGRAEVAWGGSAPGRSSYEQVFFTGPSRLARSLVDPALLPVVEQAERRHPTSGTYLGVACVVLVLKKPLTPYYVLNIADDAVELTGLIEVTNLIDRSAETGGMSLVYLPRYLDSADRSFEAPEEDLVSSLLDRGARRLFPRLSDADIVDRQLHRARFVQPLPLVGEHELGGAVPPLERPLTILNTSMLECATLNNNEVVGLVNRFVRVHSAALGRGALAARSGHHDVVRAP